jgi:hypothetical protein
MPDFDVRSIPPDKVRYQLTVDLRVWIVNGPA